MRASTQASVPAMNAQTPSDLEDALPAPDLSSASPVMAQFFDAKARQPDALVFFRMGDFYELFFDDAVKAAAALGITLTSAASMRARISPWPGCRCTRLRPISPS